jgi:16S rRNA processing protein RimM
MPAADVRPGHGADPGGKVVAVGEVVGAHALRGWVRMRPYQMPAASLTIGSSVLLERDGHRRHARVTHAAPHGGRLVLLGLEGVHDRTAAEALRGAVVLIRRADLPALEEGEYWHDEVIGYDVRMLDGTVLGRVAGVMSNGLLDVLEVRAGEREYLIPVVADVVHAIDRGARRVRISPLPGLLD